MAIHGLPVLSHIAFPVRSQSPRLAWSKSPKPGNLGALGFPCLLRNFAYLGVSRHRTFDGLFLLPLLLSQPPTAQQLTRQHVGKWTTPVGDPGHTPCPGRRPRPPQPIDATSLFSYGMSFYVRRVARSRCQRSFNWQSTAFVMRGLWVRLPPLALVARPSKRPVSVN